MKVTTCAVAVVALAAVAQVDTATAQGDSGIDYTHWTLRTIRPLPPGNRVNGTGFTRDGQSIRFGSGGEIYVTSAADGSGTRCVTCTISQKILMARQGVSTWAESLDGRWLLARVPGPLAVAGLGQVVDMSAFALRLDDNGVATDAYQLTPAGHDESNLDPIFTPDGSEVIWWQNRGVQGQPPEEWKRWKIMIADFVVDADGVPHLESERPLVDPGGAFVEDGGITADGKTYYYTKTVSGDPELFALDMGTGAEVRLTEHIGWDEFPVPSPNGEVVYFISDRDHSNPLCDPIWSIATFAGLPSDLDYLTVIPGSVACGVGEGIPPRQGAPPITSIDPTFIEPSFSNFESYLMDPSGQRVTRLTFGGDSPLGSVSWSPDSRELALARPVLGASPDEIPILRFAEKEQGQ